jgi:hypothetical protein
VEGGKSRMEKALDEGEVQNFLHFACSISPGTDIDHS